MSDVTRHDIACAEVGGGFKVPVIRESEDGDYVLHSDYAILESKFKIACAQNRALLEQRNSILSRHTALVEAVTRLQKLDRDRPLHPVTDGRLIDARAEVDRLLSGDK